MLTSMGQTESIVSDISLGPQEEIKTGYFNSSIIGHDSTGFFVLDKYMNSAVTVRVYDIARYNNQLDRTKTSRIDTKMFIKERNRYLGIYEKGDSLFMLLKTRNKKEQMTQILVQNINKETCQLNPEQKIIRQLNTPGTSGFTGNFEFRISKDRSKILAFKVVSKTEEGNRRYKFHVFDENFKQLWANIVTLPYDNDLFQRAKCLIDNFGNVHLAGKIYAKNPSLNEKNKKDYRFQLISFFDNSLDVREYPIGIESRACYEVAMYTNAAQDIICAGFYSNEALHPSLGVYFLQISNETKEIVVENYNEVNSEIPTTYGLKYLENNDFRRYGIGTVCIAEDDGVFILGEETYHDGNAKKPAYTPYDILAMKILPDGSIEWAKNLDFPIGYEDKYRLRPFNPFTVDDKLLFFLNGKTSADTYLGKYRYSNTYIVELDTAGNSTFEIVQPRGNTTVSQGRSELISKNELILYSFTDLNKYQWMKLTIKE